MGSIRNDTPASDFIVIRNYKDNKFTIFDPELGKVKIEEELLKESLESLKKKRRRDNRMIVFG